MTVVHGSYFGDGTTLTGVAKSTDLTSNTVRIENLETLTQPVDRGGTGLTSYTAGDILYAHDGDTLSKLALGANGKVLKSNGHNVYWGDDEIYGEAGVGTLDQVLNTGNTTSNTIIFTNTTNAINAAGNISASSFYGDGTTLTGIALSTDLSDNVTPDHEPGDLQRGRVV